VEITIRVIDHKDQRYETCGDWQFTDYGLLITVSKMGDFRKEMCVAVHELCEVLMCMHKGISQHDVDKFDMAYEENRREGDDSEPGDSPLAPYNRQHIVATVIERILAHELDIDWVEYEETINKLSS